MAQLVGQRIDLEAASLVRMAPMSSEVPAHQAIGIDQDQPADPVGDQRLGSHAADAAGADKRDPSLAQLADGPVVTEDFQEIRVFGHDIDRTHLCPLLVLRKAPRGEMRLARLGQRRDSHRESEAAVAQSDPAPTDDVLPKGVELYLHSSAPRLDSDEVRLGLHPIPNASDLGWRVPQMMVLRHLRQPGAPPATSLPLQIAVDDGDALRPRPI